jgi:hypothetical protein
MLSTAFRVASPVSTFLIRDAPEQFLTAETEQPFGLCVHEDDRAGLIDNDHRIGRSFEEAAELIFGLLLDGRH